MEYSTLKVSRQDHVGSVTLDRPDALNTMNPRFWQELPAAFAELDKDPEVRVIVLSSTGKHFSAGMDLAVFQQFNPHMVSGEEGRKGEYIRRAVLDLQHVFSQLEKVRVPVIGAVQGGCIGGALDLLCCTDFRYCTQDAFFQIKEIDLGMTADLGTLQRLPRLISPGLVRELAYTGERLPAAQALQVGLVNRVFEDQASMLDAVQTVAQSIARKSPLAVHGTKVMLNYSQDHSLADSLDYMALWQAGMFRTEDMRQAMTATMQGSVPEYAPLTPQEFPIPGGDL